MGSEISAPLTLREREWKTRKDRIGAAAIEVAEFMVKRTIDILPDLYAINVKKLYELGGYESFKDFLKKCAGVSPQHYYRTIKEHPEARKVLEINEGESHNETFGALEQPAQEPQKTMIEAPKKSAPKPTTKQAKARVISTEPNLPMHTTPEPPENLPYKANVCPHCHGTGRIE